MPNELDPIAKYIREVFDQYPPATFLTLRQIWAVGGEKSAPSMTAITACLFPPKGGFHSRVPNVIGIVASRMGGLDIRDLAAAQETLRAAMRLEL